MKPAFKDPSRVPLIHEFERIIAELDQMEGLPDGNWDPEFLPRDSQAKSALRRVMGHVKGRPPKAVKSKKDGDRWIDALTGALWALCQDEATAFSGAEKLSCLAAIENSAKRHAFSDGRGYLDYLKEFFRDADARMS